MDSQENKINENNFSKKLQVLLKNWEKKSDYKHLDALIIAKGQDGDDVHCHQSEAFHFWLFQFDLLNTIFAFTKKTVIVMGASKKIKLITNMKDKIESLGLTLKTFKKFKKPKKPQTMALESSNAESFLQIFAAIRADSTKPDKTPLQIGTLTHEVHVGKLYQEFTEFLNKISAKDNLQKFQIKSVLQEGFNIKNPDEQVILCQAIMRQSGRVSVYFESKLIEKIESVIDEEETIGHNELSKMMETMLESPMHQSILQKKYGLDPALVDFCYTPIIQSGGEYNFKPTAESNNEKLSSDTIVLSYGGEYKQYKTNMVRTLIINPHAQQKTHYELLRSLHQQIITDLKPGAKINEVFNKGAQMVKSRNPELLKHLCTNFGFGIGLQFRESNLIIRRKNETVVQEGMFFNVAVSLKELKSEKGKMYGLMIADTVQVTGQGGKNITGKIPSKYDDISYTLDDSEEEEEAGNIDDFKIQDEEEKQEDNENGTQVMTRTRGRDRTSAQKLNKSKQDQRKSHQKVLLVKLRVEMQKRFEAGDFTSEDTTKNGVKLESLQAYREDQSENMPKMKRKKILIDKKHMVLFLPIQGNYVPFHISVVKNISKSQERDYMKLRLNFATPAAYASTNLLFPEIRPEYVYIRDISFKSKDIIHFSRLHKEIKDLIKLQKQLVLDSLNSHLTVKQDRLILIMGRKPTLEAVKLRPPISGRKVHGELQAHKNGFKYISNKNQRLDIILKNIQHAIFQPCDKEFFVIIHFHLHHAIKVGKKMVLDLQFIAEAGIQAEEIDQRYGRRGIERNQYEEDQRQRTKIRKLNQEFRGFCQTVENNFKSYKFTFDSPYRPLGFYGCPVRSNVYLMPTVKCLISISEHPFFVLTLKEVEVAHFERISYNLRNFDLCFIFKDYTKPVLRISAIPTSHKETIMNWLDQMDIIFSQGPNNYQWKNLMKVINTDPKKFIDDGGWGQLQETDDEGEENSEEEKEDPNFEYNVEDEEEDDYDIDEDDIDDEYSDDEEAYSDDEGMDWDELEDQAQKSDMRRIGR